MTNEAVQTEMKQPLVLPLEFRDRLNPQYLNSFRNTEHYQNALAQGVQIGTEIVPVTLSDIISASEVMKHVFADRQIEHNSRTYKLTFRQGIYQSPTMRVVAFDDKIRLARAHNQNAFGDARSNAESIFGYAGAIERLGTFDKAMKRIKNPARKEERQWCIDELTRCLKSEEGLSALYLWTLHKGEIPRIKNTKTARQTYENIIRDLLIQLESANTKIADYTRKELE